jgi:hypothetical protein
MASRTMEARLVIAGDDKTAAAFHAIEKKMASIGKGFGGASKDAQSNARNMSVLGGTGWQSVNRDMLVLGGNWKNISWHVEKAEASAGRLRNAGAGRTMDRNRDERWRLSVLSLRHLQLTFCAMGRDRKSPHLCR